MASASDRDSAGACRRYVADRDARCAGEHDLQDARRYRRLRPPGGHRPAKHHGHSRERPAAQQDSGSQQGADKHRECPHAQAPPARRVMLMAAIVTALRAGSSARRHTPAGYCGAVQMGPRADAARPRTAASCRHEHAGAARVSKTYGQEPPRCTRCRGRPVGAGRGDGGGDGAERVGQVHAADHRREPGGTHQRGGAGRGMALAGMPRAAQGPAAAPGDRVRVPGFQPAARADRRRERALPLELDGVAAPKARAAGLAALDALGVADRAAGSPISCPAASGSGWRSPARWWGTASCCWPTSRPARWTR